MNLIEPPIVDLFFLSSLSSSAKQSMLAYMSYFCGRSSLLLYRLICALQSVPAPAQCSWQGIDRSLVASERAIKILLFEQRLLSSDVSNAFIVSRFRTLFLSRNMC